MFWVYLISFLMFMPLTVYFNDVLEGSQLYMMTFSEVMSGPLYWLSLTVTCAVVLLPYYGVQQWWNVILYPEFNVD